MHPIPSHKGNTKCGLQSLCNRLCQKDIIHFDLNAGYGLAKAEEFLCFVQTDIGEGGVIKAYNISKVDEVAKKPVAHEIKEISLDIEGLAR